MYTSRSILPLFALLSITSAVPSYNGAPQAVYFLDNEPQNGVVSLRVGNDGKLSEGGVARTGGAGGQGTNGMTGMPAGPDAAFSQSSLTVAGDLLFAVNAGSNTISMLAIDANNPTQLRLVGQPVSTLGDFPNSVTASLKNSLVCVSNTGAKAGIACAHFDQYSGIASMDHLRKIDLGQTTPPVGPTSTISQTFFSEDETALYTTVKGDGMDDKGFFASYAVKSGHVAKKGVRSSPAGTAVLFGSDTIPGDTSRIFVSDASIGGALIHVGRRGRATTIEAVKVPDQVAICWAIVADATGTGFLADTGKNSIVEVDLNSGAILANYQPKNKNDGYTDMIAAGNYLWALNPGKGGNVTTIQAFDLGRGAGKAKAIQNYKPEGVVSGLSIGMAAY